MPLTAKGEEILANMKSEYGAEKGEQVFYASKNAGKITGVDNTQGPPLATNTQVNMPGMDQAQAAPPQPPSSLPPTIEVAEQVNAARDRHNTGRE